MPTGAEMRLAPNEPKLIAHCSISQTTSEHDPQVERDYRYYTKPTNGKS